MACRSEELIDRSYASILAIPDDGAFVRKDREVKRLLELARARNARLVTACPPSVRARLLEKVSVEQRDNPYEGSRVHDPFMVTRVGLYVRLGQPLT